MNAVTNDVFVSYSANDISFARELVHALRHAGLSAWYEGDAIHLGEDVLQRLEDALENSRFFVLVISRSYASTANTMFELGVAIGRSEGRDNVPIIPVLVEDVNKQSLPSPIRKKSLLDATKLTTREVAEAIAEVVNRDKEMV